MFDLQGMRIIISGAAGGIGHATALMCARMGASVIATDIRPLDRLQSDIEETGDRFTAIRCDVSQFQETKELAERVGTVSGIVAAAGIQPYDDWRDPDWEQNWTNVLSVNALGAVNLTRAFFEDMKSAGGKIVLVGSQAGRNGGAYSSPHYVFSKGGIHSYCRWLAKKGTRYGIHVNCVAPGPVNTPFVDGLEIDPSELPLGRIAGTDDVAGPIVFLLSPAANYITGVILDVNGGLSFN
ncbi:MAG: SDR family oxidoreductase [Pseudomonadota bacterium]